MSALLSKDNVGTSSMRYNHPNPYKEPFVISPYIYIYIKNTIKKTRHPNEITIQIPNVQANTIRLKESMVEFNFLQLQGLSSAT